MSKTKVYSYLRFSDPKQAAGHSAERQLEYARRWAETHGMVLDTSLTLRDEGLSAYHQRHVKQGALGVFLLAVDGGKIDPGSVLIVEGLDRLSRAEPIQAQAQLAQIINAGITVVTASDGREYNRANLKAQPMDLVYSLLVMIRAHEESDTKSKRVKAAIRRQCQAWVTGAWRGVIRNGKDPAWVRWNGSAFELIQDRADALQRLIDLWLDGNGFAGAMFQLRGAGMDMSLLPATPATLYKIIHGKYIKGCKTIEVDGEEFDLDGYYPALVDEEKFQRLQVAATSRHRAKGKGEIPGILTGMGISVCGYCGSAMASQNISNRPKKQDGTLQDGHRRIHCCGGAHRCDYSGGCSSVPIERAILTYCSDQFRLDALCASETDKGAAARAALAEIRRQTADVEKRIGRVTAAMLADESGATPLAFVRAARELEAELAALKERESTAESEAIQAGKGRNPAAAQAWQSLFDGVMSLDYAERMRARQLVADTFERIVIYHRGVTPGDPFRSPIDLVLIAKGGDPRLLRINRRSGDLIEQEDIATRQAATNATAQTRDPLPP